MPHHHIDDAPLPESFPNSCLVGSNGAGIVITIPPTHPMAPDEALTLAAWLTVCALDIDGSRFQKILDKVVNP